LPRRVAPGQARSSSAGRRNQGPQQQHDSSSAQHVLGSQPFDRHEGRRGDRRRVDRSLAGGKPHSADAASGWRRQTRHQLPACDRLAGAQARGAGGLPVPGGHVSHQPLSHRLRWAAARSQPSCGGPRVLEDPATGGPRQPRRRARRAATGDRPERADLSGRDSQCRRASSASAAGDRDRRGAAGPKGIRFATSTLRQGGREP